MPLFGEMFLSEILNKPVLDPTGEELGKVKDFCIVMGEHLPKISFLVIEKKTKFKISWEDLSIFNKKVISSRLSPASLTPYIHDNNDLLAVRDILDKQIVDANGAKVVRVNDIKVEGYNTDAVLIAVDVGMRGILRRLGIEKWGEDFMKFFRAHLPYNLISWNYIQPLSPKLTAIALKIPKQMMSELHPADLAELLTQVSHDEGASIIETLDSETAADTISELEPEHQSAMINEMDTEKASDIIEQMTPDDAADILSDLPAEKAKDILESLEEETAKDIQELLSHDEDTAGGIMTTEFISYPQSTRICEVIERFKADAPEVETVYYIYATDTEGKLTGVISLKELILSEPEQNLNELMEMKVKSVTAETDDMEVVRIVSKYNLVALPVVDDEGKLIGVVTVDDAIDRILPHEARKHRRRKM